MRTSSSCWLDLILVTALSSSTSSSTSVGSVETEEDEAVEALRDSNVDVVDALRESSEDAVDSFRESSGDASDSFRDSNPDDAVDVESRLWKGYFGQNGSFEVNGPLLGGNCEVDHTKGVSVNYKTDLD